MLEDACRLILVASRGNSNSTATRGVKQEYEQDAVTLAMLAVRSCAVPALGSWRRTARKSIAFDGSECPNGEISDAELDAILIWCVLHGLSSANQPVTDRPIYSESVQAGFALYEKIFGRLGTAEYRKLLAGFRAEYEPTYRVLKASNRNSHDASVSAYGAWRAQVECCKAFDGDDFLLVYNMELEEALWRLSGGVIDRRRVRTHEKDADYYRTCRRDMESLAYLWRATAKRESDHTRMTYRSSDAGSVHYFEELFKGDADMVNVCAYVLEIDVKMKAVLKGISARDAAI